MKHCAHRLVMAIGEQFFIALIMQKTTISPHYAVTDIAEVKPVIRPVMILPSVFNFSVTPIPGRQYDKETIQLFILA